MRNKRREYNYLGRKKIFFSFFVPSPASCKYRNSTDQQTERDKLSYSCRESFFSLFPSPASRKYRSSTKREREKRKTEILIKY